MKNRSLFWPFVLIAIGVLWILRNLGMVPASNLWALYQALPYLLLLLGVGLILRARWPVAGRIVSALVVVAALLAVIFAPQLGWDSSPKWSRNGEIFPLFTWGIHGDGSVPGSGVIKTETRPVSEFTAISIDYPVEIVVHQGAQQSVTLRADDNLLPQLVLRVSGDTLYIENSQSDWNKRVDPSTAVELDITVANLSRVDFPTAGSLRVEGLKSDDLNINASGAGEVNLNEIDTGHLGISLSGAGDVKANGKAASVDMDISGVGSFSGENLSIQSARVSISGAGSATLWVVRQLDVDISGIGSVNYYGSPSIDQSVSGLGSVDHIGNK